jgi:hypothetical protein
MVIIEPQSGKTMTSATTQSLAANQMQPLSLEAQTLWYPRKGKKTSGTKHHDRGAIHDGLSSSLYVDRIAAAITAAKPDTYTEYKSRMDKIKLPRCLLGAGTYDLNTDKGEVGGSSPPRPTVQITSKYASILTFPLFGLSLKKPFCQPFVNFMIGRMALHSGR